MIRVGFAFEFDTSWLGGINYYRNLLTAIHALPERKIEPVIIVGSQSDTGFLEQLPAFKVVRSKLLDRYSVLWLIRKVVSKILRRDLLLELLLRKMDIDVLSHSGSLGWGSRISCLCWIPDFQHKRMPQFFTEPDIRSRDHTFSLWGKCCSGIILSSADAKRDALKFYPKFVSKLEVLQFVSEVSSAAVLAVPGAVEKKYALPRKYFLVANQFWAHKNHKVIIDALKHLRDSGRSVRVVATGKCDDYRQPGFYQDLIDHAQQSGVLDDFTTLGVVPHEDLAALMRGAVAVVNPSMFEGWNTAVEEAKSLGRRVILSDTPVHREQNPDRANFFHPEDAETLADILWESIVNYDLEIERIEMQSAERGLPARQHAFARKYQQIVLGVVAQ